MSDREISDRDPAYLFGRVIARLDEQDKRDEDRERRNREAHTEIVEKLEGMNQRVSKLERCKAYVLGGATLGGGGGIAALWSKLTSGE